MKLLLLFLLLISTMHAMPTVAPLSCDHEDGKKFGDCVDDGVSNFADIKICMGAYRCPEYIARTGGDPVKWNF